MGLRLNQLQATITSIFDDIFHLRTSGGLDKKITMPNLRQSFISYTEISANTVAPETASEVGKVQIFKNIHASNTITLTLGTSGNSVALAPDLIVFVLYNGSDFFEINLDGVPVGNTYFQLPNKPSPATLFGGTWANISSTFSGDFFRAEGTNALSFQGGRQADENKSHTHFYYRVGANAVYSLGTIAPTFDGLRSNTTWVSSSNGTTEARPTNQTIRVWERTA